MWPIRALQRRPIYLLEHTVAAGVEPQRVHRWRSGAGLLGEKEEVCSMVGHETSFLDSVVIFGVLAPSRFLSK